MKKMKEKHKDLSEQAERLNERRRNAIQDRDILESRVNDLEILARQVLENEHQELGGHPFHSYDMDREEVEKICPRCN